MFSSVWVGSWNKPSKIRDQLSGKWRHLREESGDKFRGVAKHNTQRFFPRCLENWVIRLLFGVTQGQSGSTTSKWQTCSREEKVSAGKAWRENDICVEKVTRRVIQLVARASFSWRSVLSVGYYYILLHLTREGMRSGTYRIHKASGLIATGAQWIPEHRCTYGKKQLVSKQTDLPLVFASQDLGMEMALLTNHQLSRPFNSV